MELLELPQMLHCQYTLYYSQHTHCDGVARAMAKEKCTSVEACSHGLGHHDHCTSVGANSLSTFNVQGRVYHIHSKKNPRPFISSHFHRTYVCMYVCLYVCMYVPMYVQYAGVCRQPSTAHQPEQCNPELCMDRLVKIGKTLLTGGSASGRGRGEGVTISAFGLPDNQII